DVGRVVSGKIRLERRSLDLGALVCGHIDALREAGSFAAHDVTCELAPVQVSVDPPRVQQIVDNLLGNALKFTPPGGKIRVRVAQEGDQAVLEVADTGIGMSPELMDTVFDLFVQGERTSER